MPPMIDDPDTMLRARRDLRSNRGLARASRAQHREAVAAVAAARDLTLAEAESLLDEQRDRRRRDLHAMALRRRLPRVAAALAR